MKKFLLLGSLLTFIFSLNVNSQVVVTNADELQAIADDLTESYILGNDIDLTGFEWISIMDFAGEFDGDGHVITGLFAVNDLTKAGAIFGKIVEGSLVKNVGVVDAYVVSGWYASALVGDCLGAIENSYATGYVECVIPEDGTYVGNVGGLVGNVRGTGTVLDCYSTVEMQLDGTHHSQGGFAGNINGWVENCYYAGEIVDASDFVDLVGGFCGTYYETVMEEVLTSCYYDMELTELEGPLGRYTDELVQESTYDNWDFTTVWEIDEGVSYPTLRIFNTTTAIDDLDNDELNLSIYPNPSTSHFYFNNTMNAQKIEIFNAASIKVKEVILNAKQNKIAIDNLSDGLYFVKILSPQKSHILKLVKQ